MLRLSVRSLIAVGFSLACAPFSTAQPNKTEVTALAYSPDGRVVLSSGLDGNVRFWDAATGTLRAAVLAHKDGAHGVAFAADGKRFASAGADRKVRLWDTATVKELQTFEGHEKLVIAVAISPDGKSLASGGFDGTIRVWDVAAGRQRHKLRGGEGRVTALAFVEGGMLASAALVTYVDRGFTNETHLDRVRLWDIVTGKESRVLGMSGYRLAVAADGKTIAGSGMYIEPSSKGGLITGSGAYAGGSRITVWDAGLGRERRRVEQYWTAAALSPDGKFLASGWGTRLYSGGMMLTNEPRGKGIHLWETATGKEVLCLPVPQQAATVLAYAPDHTRLAAGRADGTVQFHGLAPPGWDAKRAVPSKLKALEGLWAALADAEAARAYEAIWTLAAAGPEAVAYLDTKLEPTRPKDQARIHKLIADLDSPQFAVREAASKELAGLGADVESDLRRELETKPGLESQRRVQSLLEAIEQQALSPEQLRMSRAVCVLERIGGPQAQHVLKRMADGAPGTVTTKDAQDALHRLRLRPPTP